MITAILQVVAERLLTAIPGGKDLPLLDSENQTRTQGFVLAALLELSTVLGLRNNLVWLRFSCGGCCFRRR
ncbi:MAG TPA: hypothetical protein VE267_13410, partial [Bradyrhizobium sp.]|nr:hypothetical protein [Bradyrhizobium sp.]